jgi:putative peptide zinc metalloprotease protein
VLVLRRADLLHVMGVDRRASKYIIDLVSLRDRPHRVPGILAYHRTTPDGETITILKDPQRGAYYRLSPQGWFVWQHLDGEHNHRDLTLDYFTAYKAFAPQAVAEIVSGLAAAGFVTGTRLRADVQRSMAARSPWERAALIAQRLLTWRIALHNVDPYVTALYRAGVHVVYTWPAQIMLAVLALGGIVAFVLTATQVSMAVLRTPGGMALLWFFIPALLVSLLIHEAGHAFTTKAFGHTVVGAGVGWYWFAPVAFVDTSDMWLAGRWPRIAVSLAGPYTNLITGSISSLVAWLVRDPMITAALWQFALTSYLIVLRNLNPLLERDGYYVLIDWLECPNLRARAFSWLRNELPTTVRAPSRLRGHWLDLAYGLAAVAYVALAVALMTISYRLLVQDWLTLVLPASVASVLTWGLAGGLIVLYGLAIASELWGQRRPLRA